jgi:hypothetical protein
MLQPSDPLDVGIALAQAFEAHGIEYALGGALAYGIWGIPRATLDVDINVFVEDDELPRVAAALADLGLQVDATDLARDSRAKGLIVLRFGGYRVDLFTPSIPFSYEAGTHAACCGYRREVHLLLVSRGAVRLQAALLSPKGHRRPGASDRGSRRRT